MGFYYEAKSEKLGPKFSFFAPSLIPKKQMAIPDTGYKFLACNSEARKTHLFSEKSKKTNLAELLLGSSLGNAQANPASGEAAHISCIIYKLGSVQLISAI